MDEECVLSVCVAGELMFVDGELSLDAADAVDILVLDAEEVQSTIEHVVPEVVELQGFGSLGGFDYQ